MTTQKISARQGRIIALLLEHFNLDAESEPYQEYDDLTIGSVQVDSAHHAVYTAKYSDEFNYWTIEVVFLDIIGLPERYEFMCTGGDKIVLSSPNVNEDTEDNG